MSAYPDEPFEQAILNRRGENATKDLLALLRVYHPEHDPAPLKPVAEPVVEMVLVQKPIPNQMMAFANELACDAAPSIPAQPRIIEIQHAVCDYFGMKRIELLSKRRHHNVVRPRQVGIYLCKQMTTRSLPEIGRKFGGLDHTTCIAAIRRVDGLLATDPKIFEAVQTITARMSA